jgi:uncharacterized protein (TIGR00369 family)
MSEHVLTPDDLHRFIAERFPQAVGFARVVTVGGGALTLELEAGEHHLRPGGTVSGPTLMTMADTAMYFLVLSLVGPVALAVTTNLNINFLRRPPPGTLLATARLLKRGQRLVVGEVAIHGPGAAAAPVAHATVTYALPPDPGDGAP